MQALKNEPFHNSFLARSLLRRAVWNPNDIGIPLFWLLKVPLAVHVTWLCCKVARFRSSSVCNTQTCTHRHTHIRSGDIAIVVDICEMRRHVADCCVPSQSELYTPGFQERCLVLLHTLVAYLGPFLPIISLQVSVNNVFEEVACEQFFMLLLHICSHINHARERLACSARISAAMHSLHACM